MSELTKQLQTIVDNPEYYLLDQISDIAKEALERLEELERLSDNRAKHILHLESVLDERE